jgi:hypothetical protein
MLVFMLLACSMLGAVTTEEIRWLLDREQFPILAKYGEQIGQLASGSPEEVKLALEYAVRTDKADLALKCHARLALAGHSLEDAVAWFRLAADSPADSLAYRDTREELEQEFSSEEDRIALNFFTTDTPDEEVYLDQIRRLRGYNSFIEDIAKARIDEISVERSDSLALGLIERFNHFFPISKWSQVAYYYSLYHLSNLKDFARMEELIQSQGQASPVHLYITALYLLSPSYRRQLGDIGQYQAIGRAEAMLRSAVNDYSSTENTLFLYDEYTPEQWRNRLELTLVKAGFYRILAAQGLYGDEAGLTGILDKGRHLVDTLLADLRKIEFKDNDRGDLAEVNYWQGRIEALPSSRKYMKQAALSYVRSLVYGAPRKKYDLSCLQGLEELRLKLNVRKDLMRWARSLLNYKGIIFREYPFLDKKYTRIAIGDYDNDSYPDLLFNGNALYHNEQGWDFIEEGNEANVSGWLSNGGLWADFNLDGRLDFATISHNQEGQGEALMKNQDGTKFVKVNERAGDIDDRCPTEGAAWIDIDGLGYPSFYTANYEQWEVRSGFPDNFWYNRMGYLSDESVSLGFRTPPYTDNPGQAGRGVAPADFDNDGQQEILVTNYRLNRNFCWDQSDSLFTDVAANFGLAGKYKQGYYGHSIGADWGDYDNDGDLDLFIANLAHPRYIDISDISQLLRNDGLQFRVIGADTLSFWQFTDITREAGITYDELYSDPLWFDADNDGWLDLFITSVYENDRSYLYRNNGNGTFTDITFLAGARVYNGWGNATADLDRDGLADLVVGSGNGTKIFLNKTRTSNRSLYIKPVWENGKVILMDDPADYPQHPNSPAYGTRVRVTLRSGSGKLYSLIRELCSAKGTASQSSQELHFGLGRGKIVSIERIFYEKGQN